MIFINIHITFINHINKRAYGARAVKKKEQSIHCTIILILK